MKKPIYLLAIALILSFSFVSVSAYTLKESSPYTTNVPLTKEQKELRLKEITRRVEAIKALDKSDLSRQERKELRKELRELKEQAKPLTGGGVYLSVGAILLIILALLILL